MKKSNVKELVNVVLIVIILFLGLFIFAGDYIKKDNFMKEYTHKKIPMEDIERMLGNCPIILDEEYSYVVKNHDSIQLITFIALIGGGVVGIFLFIEFCSVEIYTNVVQKKKRRRQKVGRMFIFKMGNTFYGFINGHLIEKSMMGSFQIEFGEEFVERYRHELIKIKLGDQLINETIKPVIYVREMES